MIVSSTVPIIFKPIFGKGRDGRWDKFQEIFKTAFKEKNELTLIEQAETRKDLKYRLIMDEKSHAIGIAILSPFLSNDFAKLFGLKSAYFVKALHMCSFNDNLGPELIETASLSHAKSIVVKIAKTDIKLQESLESASFQKMNAQSAFFQYYSYVIEEVESKKREREEELLQEEKIS